MKYRNIDLAKFVFAFCVIALHTSVSSGQVSNLAEFVFKHFFCRLAVPFFFFCAGYFFALSTIRKGELRFVDLKKYICRLLPAYLFWGACGSVVNLIHGNSIKDIAHQWLLGTPGNAMWYISALLISISLVYFFEKHSLIKVCFTIGLLGFIVCNAMYGTYSEIFSPYYPESFLSLIRITKEIILNSRNFLGAGLLFVCMGYGCAKQGTKLLHLRYYMAGIGVVVLSVEICLLYVQTGFVAQETDFFIGHIFLVPAIFFVLANCRQLVNDGLAIKLRKYSTSIYFSHMMAFRCVNFVGGDCPKTRMSFHRN